MPTCRRRHKRIPVQVQHVRCRRRRRRHIRIRNRLERRPVWRRGLLRSGMTQGAVSESVTPDSCTGQSTVGRPPPCGQAVAHRRPCAGGARRLGTREAATGRRMRGRVCSLYKAAFFFFLSVCLAIPVRRYPDRIGGSAVRLRAAGFVGEEEVDRHAGVILPVLAVMPATCPKNIQPGSSCARLLLIARHHSKASDLSLGSTSRSYLDSMLSLYSVLYLLDIAGNSVFTSLFLWTWFKGFFSRFLKAPHPKICMPNKKSV